MSTQEQSKIEELSDKVRTLVDKVSVLERENRSLREKYRDALERAHETGARLEAFVASSLQSPFGNNDGKGFEIPTSTTYSTKHGGIVESLGSKDDRDG